MTEVVLVSMPFGPVFWPSFALSLLKAELSACGIDSRVHYFTIAFAERTGEPFYSRIAEDGSPSIRELVGEWVFSKALFATSDEQEASYVDDILRRRSAWANKRWARPISETLISRILRARAKVDGFLDDCLREIVADGPRIVGFTSVFQQHVASLALAKRVKAALPNVFVVFGGANCEGVMGAETVRQFPFVDAAVSGEGDLVFPELVRRVLAGRPLAGLAGVRTPATVQEEFRSGIFSSAPMVRDLDALPYPAFDDYFEAFRESRFDQDWQPGIFFESSRGCWWGEKMHCTFCGLNGQTMAYRSKSAPRALDEITHLSRLHPGCDVQVVDNILDMSYFKDLVPELARQRLGLELFYETKANLRKEQVRMLRAARITGIQPGIESFSDPVLKLMRKGVSALQNIQLLKWCKELAVRPFWNILWGFPGEDPGEYERMARLVPLLTHLPAPVGYSGIRLDRFSPNFFDAERLGFEDVAPLAPYAHVYPLEEEAVRNLAYYFSFRYREPRDVDGYIGPFLAAVKAWKASHERSDLFSVDADGHLLIWDLRPAARQPLTVIHGLDRFLYQACDAASDPRQIAHGAAFPPGTSPSEVASRLDALVECGLAVTDGPRYLALAVPLGEYAPAEAVVARFYDVARGLGRRERGELQVPLNGAFSAAAQGRRPHRSPRRGGGHGKSLSPAQFTVTKRGQLLIR